MNERLKKRLMRAADVFTWSVFVCFGLAMLYFVLAPMLAQGRN